MLRHQAMQLVYFEMATGAKARHGMKETYPRGSSHHKLEKDSSMHGAPCHKSGARLRHVLHAETEVLLETHISCDSLLPQQPFT